MTFEEALQKHLQCDITSAAFADGEWTVKHGDQVVFIGRVPGEGAAAGSALFHTVVRALNRDRVHEHVSMAISDEVYASFLNPEPVSA